MSDNLSCSWAYGLFAPLNWGEDCDAETERMRALWNQLVEIDRAARVAYRDAVASAVDPDLAAAMARAVADIEAAKAAKKQARQHARSKKIETPEIDADLAAARAAYVELKPLHAAAKAKAKLAAKARTDAIEAARKAAVKAARQASGCYWGNYNAVIASYETARKAAMLAGTELRFRGGGRDKRLVAQIQGGLSPARLFAATHSQASLRRPEPGEWPMRKLHPHGYILSMVAYTTDRRARLVRWPMILHRPFPAGAQIKQVTVTCRRRPPRRDEWQVAFALTVPGAAAVERKAELAAGIDVGWRKLEEGLRVAMLADEAGGRMQIVLPERMLEDHAYVADIAAQRARNVTDVLAWTGALDWTTAPAVLADAWRALAGNPKSSWPALARLRTLWLEHAWAAESLERLSDALAHDRRLWTRSRGMTLRLTRARLDIYRAAAMRIVQRYGLIGIEKLSVADMATTDDNPLPPAARRNRVIAAPAEFLACVRWAAKKTGAHIHEHHGASTWICASCGVESAPSDPSARVVACPHCHSVWDQDHNAARVILASALAARKTGAALEGEIAPETAGGRWGRARRLRAKSDLSPTAGLDIEAAE